MDYYEQNTQHHLQQLGSADKHEGLHRGPVNCHSSSDNCTSEEKLQYLAAQDRHKKSV